MSRHTWIVAAMLLAMAAPVRGEDTAPEIGEDTPNVALVLATTKDESEAKAWVDRWYETSSVYSQIFDPLNSFPQIISAKDLGAPDAEPGTLAVVLGFCPEKQAAPQVALLKTIYSGASLLRAAAPRAKTCPRFWPGTRLVQQKTIAIDGWRLVVSQYLGDPLPAHVPVGRRTPPDPNSGEVFIVTVLFDPDGFLRKYKSPKQYSCITDELEWPNTCDLRLTAAKNSVTVDMKWGQRPHPCSGDVSFMHVRSVFNHTGKAIEAKREVLKRDVVPACD